MSLKLESTQAKLDVSALVTAMHNIKKSEADKAAVAPVAALQAVSVPAGQGEALKAVLDGMTDSGLPAVQVVKQEGEVDVLLFTEQLDGDATVLLSGEAGLAVTNVKKWVQTWPQGESFLENLSAGTLYSNIWGALTTADSTIYNILENTSEGEQAEAVAKVRQLFVELAAHVEGLITALPVTVFKMEKTVTAFLTEAAAKAAAEAVEGELVTKSDESGTTPATDTTAVVDTAAVVDPAVAPAEATAPAGFDMQAMIDAVSAGVMKVVDERFNVMKQEHQQAITTVTEEVVKDATVVVSKAEEAFRKLGTTVVGSTADNPDAVVAPVTAETTVTKSDDTIEPLGFERA